MAARPPPVAQECVEGYLFVREPRRTLVLRRPPERGAIWGPVSGKVEADDPDLDAALRRELREETGFEVPLPLLPLDWTVRFDGPDGRPWRLTAFGVELDAPRPPRLSDEHAAFDWLDPAQARARLHYPDNRAAIDRLLERLDPPAAGAPGTP